MPELPEVETITRQLEHRLAGQKITAVKLHNTSIADKKVRTIKNRDIIQIYRRAKAIIMELEGKQYLLFRLGMTGHFKFLPVQKNRVAEKHAIATFHLEDHSSLIFKDIRKFGSLRMLNETELRQALQKLGPEPLGKEFTLAKFKEMLRSRPKAVIKTTLMDQNFIAGIGNIYAQEALFHAKIDPRRSIGSLSQAEEKILHQKLRKNLQAAILQRGTTVQNYLNIEGAGKFQKFLAVYQKVKCPKKHPLTRIYQGSRSTFFCTKCQK